MVNNKTILIIDDNQHISKPLGMILSDFGYSVKIVSNGNDPTIMQKPFADLVLLDLRLQDIKGKDVCLKIKKNKLTQHIPVIMFSADNQLKIIAKETYADDSIEKPFDTKKLLEKIEKHIHKSSKKINLSQE